MAGLITAKELKAFRYSKQMTQEQFAKKIGVSKPLISMTEANLKPVTRRLLQQIANTFNKQFIIKIKPE